MSLALDLLGLGDRGPRGGDLNRIGPTTKREWRTAGLKVEIDPETGMPNLHQFERPETTVCPIKNEQPWHRMAALALINGFTNTEIAGWAGVTPQAVSVLRSQRWFQQLLARLANDQGQAWQGVLQGEVLANIETWIAIRDDINAPVRARADAARLLMEHAVGKPTQTSITYSKNVTKANLSPQDEMEQINEELANLRRRSEHLQPKQTQ